MAGYPLPKAEEARLGSLRALDVLDSPPEAAFDRLTRTVSRSLGAPIAFVSLVDRDRQWLKSKAGLDVCETPREHAFCAHTICGDGVMVVEDARQDSRFADNPLVVGEPGIRFYAGAPLTTEDGQNVGALCVIDRRPRSLSEDERSLLKDMAAVVIDQFKMRVLAERARRAEGRLVDAVEALADGFVLYDENDQLVLCNERYREMYAESAPAIRPGATFEEIIRFGVANGQYPDAVGNEEQWIAERLNQHRASNRSVEQELPADRWLRIEERRTRDGGYVGFRVDITQLKRQQAELARLAWTDSLTGALNRRRFVESAKAECSRAVRSGRPLSLILIDVDHFKSINDRYGHAAGDAVLIEFVVRWSSVLRGSDILGRIGGEEFAILLPETDLDRARLIAERLRATTSAAPVQCDGQRI